MGDCWCPAVRVFGGGGGVYVSNIFFNQPQTCSNISPTEVQQKTQQGQLDLLTSFHLIPGPNMLQKKLVGGFNPSETYYSNISQIGSFPQVGVKITNML